MTKGLFFAAIVAGIAAGLTNAAVNYTVAAYDLGYFHYTSEAERVSKRIDEGYRQQFPSRK